jgi:hypothetical protein
MATNGNKWQLPGNILAAHGHLKGRLWRRDGRKWQRNGS